jgi:hypothetical protein
MDQRYCNRSRRTLTNKTQPDRTGSGSLARAINLLSTKYLLRRNNDQYVNQVSGQGATHHKTTRLSVGKHEMISRALPRSTYVLQY